MENGDVPGALKLKPVVLVTAAAAVVVTAVAGATVVAVLAAGAAGLAPNRPPEGAESDVNCRVY